MNNNNDTISNKLYNYKVKIWEIYIFYSLIKAKFVSNTVNKVKMSNAMPTLFLATIRSEEIGHCQALSKHGRKS